MNKFLRKIGVKFCFFYFCSKIHFMTFEEAERMMYRIQDLIIGFPIKGRLIESLFVGPTNWEDMHLFMNARIQKGEETAIIEFSNLHKSFSVYSVSVTMIDEDLPRYDMIILDNWEKTMNN